METILAVVVAAGEVDNLVQVVMPYLRYLFPILDLVAGIICLSNTQLSNRLGIAGFGFLGLAGNFVINEVFFHAGPIADNGALLRVLMVLVSGLCQLLVVVGLALAFGDLHRQLLAAGSRRDEDDRARPAWQRR